MAKTGLLAKAHRAVSCGLALCCLVALASGSAQGQDWAIKMFNTTSHDFGTVARGAKAQFRFQIKNLYEEDAHISAVRSSCGCTKPQIVKPDLKTFETGEILAEFNTKDFHGHKSATVTVTLDKPFFAEVQLHITGFIRSDVVVQPGMVDLGVAEFRSGAEQKVSVTYAGRDDWSLVDVKSPNPHITTQLVETARTRGRISYDLLVRLAKDTPAGYIQEELTLVTNDAQNLNIPVEVTGRVVSEITVSPGSLFMGVVQPGQSVTKQLIVRGKRPFKITSVKCDDASFEIEPGSQAKVVHVLPVVFTAGEREGKITQSIAVETDQGAAPTFTAYAQVVGAGVPVPAKPRLKVTVGGDEPSLGDGASNR